MAEKRDAENSGVVVIILDDVLALSLPPAELWMELTFPGCLLRSNGRADP
eukprot:CAMPEP_0172452830 /NCGR_PEP_ID=MMETSP1065-20121228/10373_1 /TAXON_ID=265537 /ORGANISM="Amphiprora paludosa, Strain CCMP125" /LENGTH=49 /DNA_ID= /DNA_START= /DNA_END= /DNA_ORIENTATION=